MSPRFIKTWLSNIHCPLRGKTEPAANPRHYTSHRKEHGPFGGCFHENSSQRREKASLHSHIRNRPAGETIYVTSDGANATRQSTHPLGNEQLIFPSPGANLDPGRGAVISLLSAEANVNNL
jgi:hypothetical protein